MPDDIQFHAVRDMKEALKLYNNYNTIKETLIFVPKHKRNQLIFTDANALPIAKIQLTELDNVVPFKPNYNKGF